MDDDRGTLDPDQWAVVRSRTEALRDVPGLRAVALGGSYARGLARSDTDIDIGLYRSDRAAKKLRWRRDEAER